MANNYTALITAGVMNNLLFMLLSSILPALVGVGLTFLVGHIRAKGLRIPLRIFGALFYSLAPIALMLCLYFNVFTYSGAQFISVVAALSISHLGYYMLCYDASASIGKNIVVNSLGLLSSTFLWSLASGYIGANDVIHACRSIAGSQYRFECYLIALLICFAVLAALNIPRVILKETMK